MLTQQLQPSLHPVHRKNWSMFQVTSKYLLFDHISHEVSTFLLPKYFNLPHINYHWTLSKSNHILLHEYKLTMLIHEHYENQLFFRLVNQLSQMIRSQVNRVSHLFWSQVNQINCFKSQINLLKCFSSHITHVCQLFLFTR